MQLPDGLVRPQGIDMDLLERMMHLEPVDKHILNEALIEFRDRGYHRANLDNIASRVGIGKGTIYRHFESKATLLFSVIIYVMLQTMAEEREKPYTGDSVQQLSQFIEFLVEVNLRWGNFFRAVTAEENGFIFKREMADNKALRRVHGYMLGLRDDGIKRIAAMLEKGQQEGKIHPDIHPFISAEVIFVSVNQYLRVKNSMCDLKRSFNMEEKHSLDEGVGELKKFIFRGLGIQTNP